MFCKVMTVAIKLATPSKLGDPSPRALMQKQVIAHVMKNLDTSAASSVRLRDTLSEKSSLKPFSETHFFTSAVKFVTEGISRAKDTALLLR